MTMIYAGNDMLQKKMVLYKMVMALTCVSSVMLMFIGTPLSMAAAIMLFLAARQICSNRYSIYAAGSRGENQVLDWLRELPDTYHVFTNVRVHERMEADAVVAGPAGLFLVEVKNYAGGLEGTSADDSWLQHKRNRQGKSYIKEIRNPLRQLNRNTFILSRYLRQEGCRAWLDACTVFPNRNAWWAKGRPEKCLDNKEELLRYLTTPRRQPLNEAAVRSTVEILKKYVQGKPVLTRAEFNTRLARTA